MTLTATVVHTPETANIVQELAAQFGESRSYVVRKALKELHQRESASQEVVISA